MSAAISRSDHPATDRVHGRLMLGFARAKPSGATVLTDLDQRTPLRAMFPLHDPCGLPTAVMVTTTGGLVGGDRLDIDVRVHRGAQALVASQAAEKVYRSLGRDVLIRINLDVAADGWLEWLPQETILFEGSRLDRRTSIAITPGARILAGDIIVFGRRAHGERLTRGLLRDGWRVARDGRAIWADTMLLRDDLAAVVAAPACFANAAAVASVIFIADDPGDALSVARDLLDIGSASDGDLRAAATVVNGLLIVRWLGQDARMLRDAVMRFWRGFRSRVAGLPPELPRVWTT